MKTISQRSVKHEPWGLLALIQIIFFIILTTLLYDALTGISKHASPSAGVVSPVLIQLSELIETQLVPRVDRFFWPDFRLKLVTLGPGVAIWASISLISNFMSAFLLFLMSVKSLDKDHRLIRSMIIVTSAAAVLLSVFAAPFFFATIYDATGATIPVDVSALSVALFIAYLAADLLSFTQSTADERQNFLILAIGVDLPLLLATIAFVFCNFYGRVSPQFAIGVSAALFAVSSLSFLFYCIWFWLKSATGRDAVKALTTSTMQGIAIGAALNGAIGFLVQLVKLPIYVDTVGSIFTALIFGPLPGMIAAVLGSIVLGVLTTPISIAYVGTAVGVTFVAWFLKRWGFGSSWWMTIILGTLVLGPLSSVLSIPITTYLFSGVTFTNTAGRI